MQSLYYFKTITKMTMKMQSRTFLVAMSSASNASTRQTAAFSNSSFSEGISDGFAWSVSTFSSSSASFFSTDERRSASVNPGDGEGGRNSSLGNGSSSIWVWFWSYSDDPFGSFFLTRYTTEWKRAKRVMKKAASTWRTRARYPSRGLCEFKGGRIPGLEISMKFSVIPRIK